MNFPNTSYPILHSPERHKSITQFEINFIEEWTEGQDPLSPSNFLRFESPNTINENNDYPDQEVTSSAKDPEHYILIDDSCNFSRKEDDLSEMVQIFQSTIYRCGGSHELYEFVFSPNFESKKLVQNKEEPPKLELPMTAQYCPLEDFSVSTSPLPKQEDDYYGERSHLCKRHNEYHNYEENLQGPKLDSFRKVRVAELAPGNIVNSNTMNFSIYTYLAEVTKELQSKFKNGTGKTDEPSDSDSKVRVSMSQNYKGNLASGFGKLLCDPGLLLDSGLYQKLVELIEEYRQRHHEIRKYSIEDYFNKITEYTSQKIYGKVERGTKKGLKSHPYKINSMEDFEEAFYPSDKDKAVTAIMKNILRELFLYFLNSKYYYTFVIRYCEAEHQGKMFLLLKVDEITKVFSSPVDKKKYRPKFRCQDSPLLFRTDFPVELFVEIMAVLIHLIFLYVKMHK